jgi:hypothetical protein
MRKATKPVRMLCTYRPKKGKEKELFALVKKHRRIRSKVGLATKEPATIYRVVDKDSGEVYFVEIFAWRDEQASGVAHQTPEVIAIWEPMESVLDRLELAQIETVGGKE